MSVPVHPNTALRRLLESGSITQQALAAAVNACGAECGLTLRYDRTSVAHWLAGSMPRAQIRPLLVEALSRLLGREVCARDAGLGSPATAAESSDELNPWVTSHVDFEALARSGADPYRLELLRLPSMPTFAGALAAVEAAPAGEDRRVGRADADAAESMLGLFSAVDEAHGGGRIRTALVGYLRTCVGPWLSAAAPAAVRRELFVTASRLSYLCGFAMFDDNLHPEAQRYYLTAMRLAAQADAATEYAVALRALSVQAHALAHHDHARELATAAVAAAGAATPHATVAGLHGQLAVACADSGDRRAAVRALADAERHLERADGAELTVGAYHLSSFAHQEAVVTARHGDRADAVNALQRSLRCRPQHERRSRAITTARLAGLQLAGGHLDAACAAWQDFCTDYPHLHSARADVALAEIMRLTRPYRERAGVQALRIRAQGLARYSKP